jgi:hypothetical protein
MPRFVRPGYIADVDNPRGRSDFARCTVTVRTAAGDVSDPVSVYAGGMDRATGAGRVDIGIPAGFTVEVDGVSILPNPRRGVSIVIRPA